MSSADDFARRRALVLAALRRNSAPTGGGGAPGASPVKPPDAPGSDRTSSADTGGVVPSSFELPPAKTGPGKNALTLDRKRLARELREAREKRERLQLPPEEPHLEVQRPRTRGDCFGGERPCPFVSCRYHTYLDVTPAGSLVINRPDVDVAELRASCSLDVADAGEVTLEQVGAVLNVTRERVRQLQAVALEKMAAAIEPKFKGSCKARCALTGKYCALPSHGDERKHRCGSWEFHLVALDGQTYFPRANEIDGYSVRREVVDVV